jgi:hypothetical protein
MNANQMNIIEEEYENEPIDEETHVYEGLTEVTNKEKSLISSSLKVFL